MKPLAIFPAHDEGVEPAWKTAMHARQARTREYAVRIERAMEAAGYDPGMLSELPANYIAAALALGVK